MKLAFDVYLPHERDENLSPVILLHGRLDSRKTWMKFAPGIAEKTKRKVYALDARNHGKSSWSDENGITSMTSDLEEFMNDHNIPKAILIGHSMGGNAAMSLALEKPEKVEKLIVEDSPLKHCSTTDISCLLEVLRLLRESLSAIPRGVDETSAKKSLYEFLKSNFPPGITKKGVTYDIETLPLKKMGDKYIWQANLDAHENTMKNHFGSPRKLPGVYHGDALFIYGNKSFFDVEKDEMIPLYFPRAVKVCIEGAGHFIHHDHPEEFKTELLKFILFESLIQNDSKKCS